MRKIIAIALILALGLSLIACGANAPANEASTVTTSTAAESETEAESENGDETESEPTESGVPEIALEDRDYYYWDEIVSESELNMFQEIVTNSAVPVQVDIEKPLRIAMLYPALDLSDAWFRGKKAFEARLNELNIPYVLTEMGAQTTDHTLQASQIELLITSDYDYAIIGPTEIFAHKAALERLIETRTEVIIWNITTPLMDWGMTREDSQPLSWVGFDHYYGAQILGKYVLEHYPHDYKVAMLYGVPGAISIQRGEAIRDIMKNAGMEIVYEHWAHFDRNQAYEATRDLLTSYPDVNMIHSVSTAMSGGAVAAAKDLGRSDVIINGWGGGSEELELIGSGELKFTNMRMQDDWGVAPAEMIKKHLEGKTDEIPLVYNGSMAIVDAETDADQLQEYLDYAFRYSGELEY